MSPLHRSVHNQTIRSLNNGSNYSNKNGLNSNEWTMNSNKYGAISPSTLHQRTKMQNLYAKHTMTKNHFKNKS